MSVNPANLFFAPCSRTNKENTFPHFQETILGGINPSDYEEAPDLNQDHVAVWGVVSGNQSHWEKMQPGDVVLFYTKTKVYTHMATVLEKQENPDLASEIWTAYDEGRRVADLNEVWPYIFYLTDVEEVNIPSQDLHEDVGWSTYYPQSFTRVIDDRQRMIEEEYGSIAACLRHHRMETAVEDPDQVIDQTNELLQPSVEEPSLTEDQEVTEYQRKIRSRAFREAVREAYDNSCAFCGSQRRTIAGTPEVEAAHIYPKSEDGVDDVRNGIALCKLHHWAFDRGWAAITDDFHIVIKEQPGEEAHEDLRHLDGKRVNLPDEEYLQPQEKFLEVHRELNGFV